MINKPSKVRLKIIVSKFPIDFLLLNFQTFITIIHTCNQQRNIYIVYLTKSQTEASGKDECWYYGEPGHDITITFLDKNPDIKIQFVDKKEDVRWINKTHKLYKRLTRV